MYLALVYLPAVAQQQVIQYMRLFIEMDFAYRILAQVVHQPGGFFRFRIYPEYAFAARHDECSFLQSSLYQVGGSDQFLKACRHVYRLCKRGVPLPYPCLRLACFRIRGAVNCVSSGSCRQRNDVPVLFARLNLLSAALVQIHASKRVHACEVYRLPGGGHMQEGSR